MSTIYEPFVTPSRSSDFNTTRLSLSRQEILSLIGDVFSSPGYTTDDPAQTTSRAGAENPEKPSGQTKMDKAKSDLEQMRDLLQTTEHQYTDPTISVGNMQEFLDKAAEYGITFRITSGERPGSMTSSGNRSRHDGGSAIDVTPTEGETYDELYDKIRNSPLLDYMVAHNIGFLEERSEKDRKKYNASASNIHISIPDESRPYGEKAAIESRKRILGA